MLMLKLTTPISFLQLHGLPFIKPTNNSRFYGKKILFPTFNKNLFTFFERIVNLTFLEPTHFLSDEVVAKRKLQDESFRVSVSVY